MSLRIPARAAAQLAAGPLTASNPGSSGKAGPLGPGAGVLMTEYLLANVMGSEPQERMRKALTFGMAVDWIRACERVIANKVTGCEWKLEDPEGETIDDEYGGNPIAKLAYELLLNPQGELDIKQVGRRQSRRQQLTITSRHMGVAGNAVWYLDMIDEAGLPHALLYIRPDRLTPTFHESGYLKGWLLDKKPGNEGTPLEVERVALLQFEPPDLGVFGPGLIESSMAKAVNNGLIDGHYTSLLKAGGRLSGIMSPKEGTVPDPIYDQMVRDWRNVTEMPESARRLQIVRAPVDFTQTVQSMQDMEVIAFMEHNRDALLALWGVPLSQLGIATASGLNGSDVRKYDEAVLWQAAVDTRLTEMAETYQSYVLDKWLPVIGWAPKLCFEQPQFDDDLPNFDMLAKAVATPMRNKERRAIIGLEPFGDPALDNAILMPMTITQWSMAPDEETGKQPPIDDIPVPEPEVPPLQVPPGGAGKPPQGQRSAGAPAPGTRAAAVAKAASLEAVAAGVRILPVGARALRDQMDEKVVPKVIEAVDAALKAQRDEIASMVERNWEAIVRHGGRDTSMYLPKNGPDPMARVLKPAIAGMAEQTAQYIRDAFGG